MKLIFFTFSLFLALMCPFVASASVSDGTVIPQSTLVPLADWVGKATDVSIDILPSAVASDKKLQRALHIEDAQHAGAVGAYLSGRVIISNRVWDPSSLEAQSYLVHELVHHAQFISGRTYPCHAAKEREAYMLQSRWLTEHGLKPLVDQAWIDNISACSGKDSEDLAD